MMKREKRGASQQARDLAFEVLWRVEATDAYADIVLEELFRRRNPDQKERALASELTFGVLRWRLWLDYFLERELDRPLKKVERKTLIALRLGAYQVLRLERVSVPASVHATVELAPPSARGFVNAVLRRLAAEGAKAAELDKIADPVERLAVADSHPLWLVREWVERFGFESAAALCRANNQRPVLTLRVNTLRSGREAFLRLLRRAGIEARPGRWSPLAVLLPEPTAVTTLPGYEEGLFAVQDEASQLAPLLLTPRPGELILDACAAPGTKSLELMELMKGVGRVVALDIQAGRLQRMAAEARRLGIRNITRVVGDATVPFLFWGEERSEEETARPDREKRGQPPLLPARFRGLLFDRILVDAPCTGLGTIRRRPEIKWKRSQEDMGRQAALQRAILVNVARYLKPGGVLVYSTCTFTREENEGAIAPLLERGELDLEDPAHLPPPWENYASLSDLVEHHMLRTWPHLTGTDGFTIFRLRKKGGEGLRSKAHLSLGEM